MADGTLDFGVCPPNGYDFGKKQLYFGACPPNYDVLII